MTWRRLPASNRLFVESRHGRAGRAVRTLAGTSDWRRDLVDRAGVAALVTVGARALPAAPSIEWPPAGLVELEQALRDELPGLRLIGVATPRQAGRARLSAVGRMTGDAVVVKLGAPDTTLDIEATALELLAMDPLPGISTPIPLASGRLVIGTVPVTYLVTNAVALGRQRAAIDQPLRTFEHDLAQRLASLPRGTPDPDSDTADLVPAHGDLTPWNLRRTGRGLALFDWESAGWAEPGSDLARYRAACDEVRRPWARRHHRQNDLLGARR
jgi:hypothetical protein